MDVIKDGTDGVNDLFGGKIVGVGDFGGASVAASQGPTFVEEFRASGTLNGAVNTTTSPQSTVGCIDNGVDLEDSDVTLNGADFVVEALVCSGQSVIRR